MLAKKIVFYFYCCEKKIYNWFWDSFQDITMFNMGLCGVQMNWNMIWRG